MNLFLGELFSQEKMSRFFEKNCRSFFGADKLISLGIFPKKEFRKILQFFTRFLC